MVLAASGGMAIGTSYEMCDAAAVQPMRKRRIWARKAGNDGYPSSKNPPTKRKLRRNRLHLSARTRRRHRRARKAA